MININYVDLAQEHKISQLAKLILNTHRIMDEMPFRKQDFVTKDQIDDFPNEQYLKTAVLHKLSVIQNELEMALLYAKKLKSEISDSVPGIFYIIQLNDTYMAEYDEKTGYNNFGKVEQALKFQSYRKALDALSEVVWGGTDNPPMVLEVCDG